MDPRRRPLRAILALLSALAVALGAASSASAATPFKDIGTGPGPLTQIALGNELSCQARHTGDTSGEFFPPSAVPADCGTFVFVDGILFAPDFANHGGGTTFTTNIGSRTVYTPVNQTDPTGAATRDDPKRVTTTVDLGSTGIQIVQTDSYVDGDEYYGTTITFNNSSGSTKQAILYRAGDCYLQNSDTGYGFSTGTGAVGCSANANNNPVGRVLVWTPQTSGSSFLEDQYSNVWSAIGAHGTFPNACNKCGENVDNGAGLSWQLDIPPGNGTAVRASAAGFSPTGQLPPGSLPPPGQTGIPTATDVICTYRYATLDDLCTATVGSFDRNRTPTGNVVFASPKGGSFVPKQCRLVPTPGTRNVASCAVTYFRPYEVPPLRSFPEVNATYTGEGDLLASTGKTSLRGCVVGLGPQVTSASSRGAAKSGGGKAKASATGGPLPPEQKVKLKPYCQSSVPSLAVFSAAVAGAALKNPSGSGAPLTTAFFKIFDEYASYNASIVDPVDRRFRKIVKPRKVRVPLLARGRHPTRAQKAFDRYLANEAASLSFQRAALTSIYRAQTAFNSKQPKYARLQMLAFAKYTSRVATLRSRHRRLASRLASALRKSGQDIKLTPKSATKAIQRLAKRGFPSRVKRTMNRIFGRKFVEALRQSALRVDPQSANTTFSKLLLVASAQDKDQANALRIMARNVRKNPSNVPGV